MLGSRPPLSSSFYSGERVCLRSWVPSCSSVSSCPLEVMVQGNQGGLNPRTSVGKEK